MILSWISLVRSLKIILIVVLRKIPLVSLRSLLLIPLVIIWVLIAALVATTTYKIKLIYNDISRIFFS